MFLDRFRYELMLMGKRVILIPILVMIGFAVLAIFLHFRNVDPSRSLSASLEMILPLAAGIVVATITSHDPVIELQLTMPKKYDVTVLCRLTLILGWTTCIALLSSGIIYALKLAYIPQPPQHWSGPLQFLIGLLTWLAPLLWFASIGLCLALLLRSRSASGSLLSGIWIVETIFKDYFAVTTWLHPVFLFPTTLLPLVGPLPQSLFDLWLTTRISLLGTAFVILLIGWLLLHNPEGLLKTSSEE